MNMFRAISLPTVVLFCWFLGLTWGFRASHSIRWTVRSGPQSFLGSKHLKSEVSGPSEELSRLSTIDISDELKHSFLSYAMSTILDRALPDVRDGLKPVHRRILYAMLGLGLTPDSSHRKCARVVGEVLGKYHPHGDQSVYDALVRLAQNFVTNHPLINGHGNFGSIDDDPPAAMRYTEAKLASIAHDALLMDIRENTVDFISNFDGNEMEPAVLPARLPMLLINGASGIAVGMSTNIPPHNLGEIVDGMVALILNPNITSANFSGLIPGPDFPTGGYICGRKGSKEFVETGHGSIIVQGRSHVEQLGKSKRHAIVITELPYLTNKAALLARIAELVNDKRIEGISDLRDESDRHGVRIVVELKKDAIADIVKNNLFKLTGLQTSFGANLLALTDGGTRPQRLSVKDALLAFIDFRFHTIRRRTQYQLMKIHQRDHVVVGLIKAIQYIDDIIQIVRKSESTEEARQALCSTRFNFTSEQSEAILGLTLRRLTSLESQKLLHEHGELQQSIKDLTQLMTNDSCVQSLMVNESLALKAKYGSPRKTEIIAEANHLTDEDFIENQRSIIVATKSGYIKRVSLQSFEAQSRGGKGKQGAKLSSENDTVQHMFSCYDHDFIVLVTTDGFAHKMRAHKIPLGSRTSKGVPYPQIVQVNSHADIANIVPLNNSRLDDSLLLLTRDGMIKKVPFEDFANLTVRGLRCMHLSGNDSLQWVRPCNTSDDVVVSTRDGYAIRFGEDGIRSTSRFSKGVRALTLRDGDSIADIDVLPYDFEKSLQEPAHNEAFFLAVTEKGFGKRVPSALLSHRHRRGKGVRVAKFKSSSPEDALVALRVCHSGDDVVMSTRKGTVIRQSVNAITMRSKQASGVTVQNISDDDCVVQVDVIKKEETLFDE